MFLNGNPFDDYKHYFKDYEEYGDGHEKMLLGGTVVQWKEKNRRMAQLTLILNCCFRMVIFVKEWLLVKLSQHFKT